MNLHGERDLRHAALYSVQIAPDREAGPVFEGMTFALIGHAARRLGNSNAHKSDAHELDVQHLADHLPAPAYVAQMQALVVGTSVL